MIKFKFKSGMISMTKIMNSRLS